MGTTRGTPNTVKYIKCYVEVYQMFLRDVLLGYQMKTKSAKSEGGGGGVLCGPSQN